MPDIKLGAVDRSVLVFVPDPASTDGSGKTGLVAANLTVSYTRVETDNDVVVTDATSSLSNLSALTDAHADWGLKEVSSTLAPGLYRLDIADAVFASGAWYAVVYVMITSSAAAASPILFTLIAFDPLDAASLGLTNLDATVSSRTKPADTQARVTLVDTVTTLTNAPSDSSGVTTLLSRLSALRAGYLDNLSAGAVALEASLQGLITTIGASAAGVATAVWANATRTLSAFDASFKTGYALSAAGVQAIWDALTSALTTVGSIGKLLVDNLNATISSRLASASYTTPPTVGAIADQVWEEAIVDHSGTVGSTAEALAAAGSAGDPWVTALPGAYGAGSAGKIVGDNLNATVSSRATQTSVDDVPTGSELATALAAGVNVTEINGTTLIGDGQIATPWGPA